MAEEVTSIGIGMETDGVERGIKSLKTLVEQGPKVEKAMAGVERAATGTTKVLRSLGDGAGKGLEDVGKSAPKATDGLNRIAKSAGDVKQAIAAIKQSTTSLGQISAEAIKAAGGLSGIASPARQAAQSIAGMAAGAKQSQVSLAELQRQVDGATLAAQKMAAEMGRMLPAMQAAAKAQEQAAKSAADMGRALDGASEKTKGFASGARGAAAANDSLSSSFAVAVRGAQALLGLQVVGWAKDGAAALFEASRAAERLRIGLDFSSAKGSAEEIRYLREVTGELGLEFSSTAKAYMQFQAAARGTAIEGDKARAVFEAISKASAVMGLSADQSAGALLALQQMVSKGTVQSEELRGQLGERLPGAFQIAARAMGVTTSELGKLLEQGQVIADDFLPKFARQLEQELGGAAEKAADRLDAAVNRFDNAWNKLKQNIGDSGVSKAMATELSAISRDITAIEETIARASAEGAGAISALGQGAAVAAGRMGFASLNLAANTLNGAINLLTGGIFDLQTNMALLPDALKTNAEQLAILSGKSVDAEEQLKHLQSLGGQFGSEVWYKNEIARATAVASEYRKALADKQALMGVDANAGNAPQPLRDRESGNTRGSRVNYAALRSSQEWLATRNDGISKSFISDIEGLAKAYASGALSAKEYAAAVAEANKKRYESTDAGKAELKALRESEKGAKSGANAYQALADKAADYVQSLQIQAQQGSKLTQSQRLQIELDSLLAKGKGKVSAATVAQTQASIAIARAMEGEALAVKRAQDAYQDYLQDQEDWAKYQRDLADATNAMRIAVAKQNIELDDQMRLLELEASLMGVSSAAREIAIEKLRVQIELEKELRDISNNTTLDGAGKQEAEAAARARAVKKIAIAERKVYVSEWEKTSQLIGDTLADYIMGGGKDAATYLKRLFSTLVLQPVVQTLVSGVMGTGAAAAAGVAGGGGIGSIANTAQSLYSMATSPMLQNFGVGLAGNIQQLGGTLFSNGFETLGTNIAEFGNSVAGFSDAINVAGDVLGYGKAIYDLSQGKYGSAVGTAIGTAVGGPIGAMIGSTLGSLADKVFAGDAGTPHIGAGAIYKDGAVSGGKSIFNGANFNFGASWNEQVQGSVTAIAGGLGSALDSVATAFGEKAGYSIYTAFADDSSDDGAWGSLRIADALGNVLVDWENSRSSKWAPKEFASGDEGYKEYLTAVAVDVKAAFLAMDLPGWADQALKTATDIDTLNAALQEIATVKSVLDGLGKTMEMFSGITGDLQTRMLTASGGIDALANSAGAFYEGFFTEGERALKQRELQMAALAGMGLYIDPAEGNAAKESFRKTVEEAMASGQAELAAQLLAMSGAFASTADYAQGVLKEMESAAKSAADAAAQAAADVAQAAAAAAQAAAQATAGAVSGAWGNLGTASGWAAQHLGDSSGLQAQMGMVQASYQGATTVAGREAALGQIIALEQSLWQIDEQNRQEAAQAAQKQVQALQGQLTAVNSILAATQRLGEYAEGLFAGAASGLSDAERLEVLAAQYSTQLTLAKGGDVDAMGKLHGVTGEYLTLAQQLSGTQSDYSVLSGRIAAELAATAVVQGASAKTQADTLQAQIDAANSAAQYAGRQFEVSAATKELVATQLKDAAKQFETEMTAMQAQLQAGMDANLLLEGLPVELTGVLNSTLVPVIGTIADAAMAAASMSAASAEAARQAAAAASAAASAVAAAAIAAASKEAKSTIPGFASGGSHIGGLRIVGENGPELEATGPSRIWNQSQLASAFGGNSNAELVAEIRALRKEVADLKAPMERTAVATSQHAEQFDSVSAGGNALAMEVMK